MSHARRERWTAGALIRLLIVGVFAWAGAVKLLAPHSMVPVLTFLVPGDGPSYQAAIVIAAALGAVELALAAAILLFAHSRPLWAVLATLLVAYTGVLAGLAASPRAPACGCLGVNHPSSHESYYGIIRNLGLLIGIELLYRRGTAGVRATPTPARHAFGPRSARGFTIIELVAVIGIVAVVVSLALPALSGARREARQANVASTIRQIALSVSMYSADHANCFPYLATPYMPWQPLRIDGEPLQTSYFGGRPPYFVQSNYYGNLLMRGYFDSRASIDWPDAYGKRSRSDPHFITPYWMTATAFAPPRYWQGDMTPQNLFLYRGVRSDECVFPASKGLLIHVLSTFSARTEAGLGATHRYIAAAVDQSAAVRSMPPEDELYDNLVSRPYGAPPVITMSTRNGMAGRDF